MGISLLVAMVNGMVAGLIIDNGKNKLFRIGNLAKVIFAVCIVITAFIYGQWRLGQTTEYTEQGPLLGSVQPNVPSDVKEAPDYSEQIFQDLIEKSNMAIQAGAKLVILPETMVMASLYWSRYLNWS